MENPAQPEDKNLVFNDVNIHYLDWGNKDFAPLVLLHGLCNNAHYWDFFARNMIGEYRLLAIDQRGHGGSSWADSYGPRDYIADLENFIDSLKLPEFTLIGHSMGGINGIIYAAAHPDQVKRLVIIDIGPEIDQAGRARMEIERSNEPEAFISEDEAIAYMKAVEPRQADEFIRHQIKYAMKRDATGKLVFKYDKKLKDTELRSPTWLWEYIDQIICPTLLLRGTESDMLSTETANIMVKNLASGSLIDIKGAGHSIPGDDPGAFEITVRSFLNDIKEQVS